MRLLKLSAFILVSVLAAFAAAADLLDKTASVYANNSGLDHLESKDLANSQKLFLQSLARDHGNLSARLNLALTFELAGDAEKAIKEYAAIAKDPQFSDSEDLFYAYFNMARLLGDTKKIDDALASYQKALSYRPDSKEVKTNIELLIQQGGGGGGSGEQQQDPQSEGGNQPQDQPQPEPGKDQEESPQEINKSDIKKIFEELKNQEQRIREMEYGEGTRQETGGKDW